MSDNYGILYHCDKALCEIIMELIDSMDSSIEGQILFEQETFQRLVKAASQTVADP